MGKLRRAIPKSCRSGKRCYIDRAAARRAGRASQHVRGAPLEPYRCDVIYQGGAALYGCGQYHLRTRKDDGHDGRQDDLTVGQHDGDASAG